MCQPELALSIILMGGGGGALWQPTAHLLSCSLASLSDHAASLGGPAVLVPSLTESAFVHRCPCCNRNTGHCASQSSMARLRALDLLCKRLGVDTGPVEVAGRCLVCPLLAWYARTTDPAALPAGYASPPLLTRLAWLGLAWLALDVLSNTVILPDALVTRSPGLRFFRSPSLPLSLSLSLSFFRVGLAWRDLSLRVPRPPSRRAPTSLPSSGVTCDSTPLTHREPTRPNLT